MRLLLAEDEKALSNTLVEILKHNNYFVDAVYDGQAAVEYIETGLYDAAIFDIMMPKLDGISALKEVRKRGIAIPMYRILCIAIKINKEIASTTWRTV